MTRKYELKKLTIVLNNDTMISVGCLDNFIYCFLEDSTMLNTLDKPDHVLSLATSAVLVECVPTIWTGSMTDSDASDEVAANNNASSGAVDVVKKLMLGCKEHREMNKFRGTINNGLRRFTYEWGGRLRLLPMTEYSKFMQWFSECETEHKRLLDNLKAVYPSYVSNAAFSDQGKLFNRADYPDVSELGNKYKLTLQVLPVPLNDFRVQVSQDLANDLHKTYEKQAEQLVSRVASEQSDRFVKVIQSLIDSCGTHEKQNADGTVTIVRKKMYESTYQKALNMIDTFAKFNPSNSGELETLRKDIHKVLSESKFDDVSKSDLLRAKMGGELDSALSKFKFNQRV